MIVNSILYQIKYEEVMEKARKRRGVEYDSMLTMSDLQIVVKVILYPIIIPIHTYIHTYIRINK